MEKKGIALWIAAHTAFRIGREEAVRGANEKGKGGTAPRSLTYQILHYAVWI